MTIRVIDIETTGTDPDKDAIIEIASVDLRPDGTITNNMSELVRPPIPIPPVSSAVHHLLDEDVANAPLLEQVIDRFKGADAYVAHNASFERSFLEQHLTAGTNSYWICTYKCAVRIWPDFTSHSNQALRYELGHVNPFGIDRHTLNPHRALSDVIVTAAILYNMIKSTPWSHLVEWSNQPALLSTVGFGKHRGMRFDAVPIDYLQWIVSGQNDLSEDVKFSAAYWLQQRTVAA